MMLLCLVLSSTSIIRLRDVSTSKYPKTFVLQQVTFKQLFAHLERSEFQSSLIKTLFFLSNYVSLVSSI